MGQQIEQLAEFVASTRWEDIPASVQQHAKLVVLDTLGVILAGSVRPEVRALHERLASGAGQGATVYTQGFPAQDPRTAALLNGISGRAIELCEGLRLVSGQAAIQVLPGVLAVAEQIAANGRELLAAFVLAYDVAGRLCTAFTPRPFAHQNGQASLLAAAAGGARARGMNAEQISRAMRVATTLVLTPSYNNTVNGATTLNVAGGMSGYVGALAPELVLAGFEAQPDAIEEALGQMVGAGFDPAHLPDELGTRWEITRNYFRLYACCNPIHPALDCLADILAAHPVRAADVEAIEVKTYRFASVMRNPDPPNYFASKYSLPHAAAVMIVRGHAGYDAIDDAALQDPEIAALRQRVRVEEDPAMSAQVPRLKPARVTLRLRDGREYTQACDSHRGDFHQPYPDAEIRAKFRELAGHVLTPAGVDAIEQAVDRSETWTDAKAFVQLLRTHGRPSTARPL